MDAKKIYLFKFAYHYTTTINWCIFFLYIEVILHANNHHHHFLSVYCWYPRELQEKRFKGYVFNCVSYEHVEKSAQVLGLVFVGRWVTHLTQGTAATWHRWVESTRRTSEGLGFNSIMELEWNLHNRYWVTLVPLPTVGPNGVQWTCILTRNYLGIAACPS